MRQIFISNTNKTFIRNAIFENKRIDFRKLEANRELVIVFGQQFGTCFIQLGQTIIFGTTSCDITEPKISRPSEGIIELSLDICCATEKWLDSYDRSLPEEGIHCLRLLERTIRDSYCLDTESLCLVTNEKVWRIKCHLICLNFDGNLTQASSIAAIASLSHFRRPDVSVSSDGNITIHSFEERNGLKLSLLHYPFCVSFVFFEDKQSNHHMVCDPLDIEEESADGSVIVCANSYHEIVGLHCSGKSVGRQNLNKCFNTAIEKVKQITTELKRALELDNSKRCDKSLKFGFAHALHSGLMASLQKPHFNLLDVIKTDAIEEKESMETSNEEIETQNVYLYGRGIASIGEGGESKWKFINTIDSDEEVMQMEHNLIKSQSNSNQFNKSDDEEEDDIIILDSNNLSHT